MSQRSGLRTVSIWDCDFGADIGVAFAEALKQNSNLRGFHVMGLEFGDESVLAFANSLKQHLSLRSFEFAAGYRGDLRNNQGRAFVKAIAQNLVLLSCNFPNLDYQSDAIISKYMQRNNEAFKTWVCLAALARPRYDHGFQTLADFQFRRALIDYFLATSCEYW